MNSEKAIHHGMAAAAKDHLLQGNRLTRLEAIVMFGVANLPDLAKELRSQGWKVEKRMIFFAEALVRLNKYASVQPPKSLPIREIMLTEYWIAR